MVLLLGSQTNQETGHLERVFGCLYSRQLGRQQTAWQTADSLADGLADSRQLGRQQTAWQTADSLVDSTQLRKLISYLYAFYLPRCNAINDQLAHMHSSDLFTKIFKLKISLA